ncbi:carbon-nitrogen hydrolase [bacterium]|nr:carbon-nitrogen hydrolase [bacterium]
MTESIVKIGLVQMRCTGDRDTNRATAEAGVRACAADGASVVVLPELFASLYFCQTEDHENFDLAEPIPGPSTERFSALAQELGVAIAVPVFERRAPGVYHNSAAMIGADGGVLGVYRKMHIPDDPGFHEKFYFTPGDRGFPAYRVGGLSAGLLICWDQWFPEAARLATLAGAEVLFYPTAIGWKPGRDDETEAYHGAWQTAMRGHAVSNGAYVVAVNRVGAEGALRFWGRSFVADPMGRVIAEAGGEAENLVVPIDRALVERTRREWPFLRDRRVDAYGGLLARFLDE